VPLPYPKTRPLQYLYVLYAFVVFVSLMLLIFPFVLLVSPLGRVRGGNLIYHLLRFWSGSWLFLVGIRHTVQKFEGAGGDGISIFVFNHISYLDVPLVVETVRVPFRALGKAEMRSVPVFGFIYRMCVVMVDRKDRDDRARSLRDMRSVLSKGISILIFPEGTFNETERPLKEFYDGAFRIAIETQTPIQPVVLLDAYERMHHHSLFSLNPGRSRALFLGKVPVEGLTPDDVRSLKARVFAMMEDALLAHSDMYRP
jgi:1-acyl-sn-glycerol-3-phosphate acyltransferase